MSNSEAQPANRVQRVLAFMIAGLVIVAIVCFAISLIGYATGALEAGINTFWTTVTMLPGLALPVALALTIALLIVTAVRRSRQNRAR